jgi:hypothetical protein
VLVPDLTPARDRRCPAARRQELRTRGGRPQDQGDEETRKGTEVNTLNTTEVSDEYLSIAQYLERVEPTLPQTTGETSIDVERADELIITANGQQW